MRDSFLCLLLSIYFIYKIFLFFNQLNTSLRLIFLDVGQGDSIFITTANRKVLIDGGMYYDIDQSLAKYIGSLFCHIDIIYPTHVDSDHIGGINRLLDRCDVDQVLFNEVLCSSNLCKEFYSKLPYDKVRHVVAGNYDVVDGVEFYTFWPTEEYLNKCSAIGETSGDCNINDFSTVLLVKKGDYEALMTGDIGKSVIGKLDINDILSHIDGRLDIYKVPHHGSRNSLDVSFISALNPEYCVISSGSGNKFGHPHEEVIENLEKIGCQILRTDILGTIEFDVQ
ncbi:MBL fold metallo-hydrolase [Patescibacteria group bacterium]|nr:MBL fold metallo-hydrolase [Patescibacteria group bacterium]